MASTVVDLDHDRSPESFPPPFPPYIAFSSVLTSSASGNHITYMYGWKVSPALGGDTSNTPRSACTVVALSSEEHIFTNPFLVKTTVLRSTATG